MIWLTGLVNDGFVVQTENKSKKQKNSCLPAGMKGKEGSGNDHTAIL